MNCNIFRILSLRANGELTCNHGGGQKVNLGWANSAAPWSADAFFTTPTFQRMRALYRRGVSPFGIICDQCYALKRNEPFAHTTPTKHLEKITVEPSLACALRSPSCSRAELAKERPGSVFLSVSVWRHMLTTLRDEGYAVDLIFMCGHGEPLAHPQIEKLVELAREYFPTTPVVINTNGNYRFADVFPGGHYPDRLIVSVDGVHQSSYEQYRINGDVATALQFMRDARQAPGRAPAVEWKYILFRYDDSDEELVAAQQVAAELDIDCLQFVLTHTPEKSTRFTPETIAALPLVWSRAYPETTPNLYHRRPDAIPLGASFSRNLANFSGAGRADICIDWCRLWSGRLVLRGWAMGVDGGSPRQLDIRINDREVGSAQTGFVREDVLHAFPARRNRSAGFNAACEISPIAAGDFAKVTVIYTGASGESFPFSVDYDLRGTGAREFNATCC